MKLTPVCENERFPVSVGSGNKDLAWLAQVIAHIVGRKRHPTWNYTPILLRNAAGNVDGGGRFGITADGSDRAATERIRKLMAVDDHFVEPVGSFYQLKSFEVLAFNLIQPVVLA